jgi:GAF domain-containing protein
VKQAVAHTLDVAGGTEPFDRITRLTQRLLGVGAAIVSLVDEETERQHFLGQQGLPPHLAADKGTHLDYSFCRYVSATGERLVVSDARDSALLTRSPAITERDVIAYAGAPLRLGPHEPALGTLCVIEPHPRTWTDSELNLLDELAEIARTELDYQLRLRGAEEVGNLALRLPDPVGRLSEAVRRVSSLVEDPTDPRLPRSADVARSRLQAVEVLTGDLARAAEARATQVETGPVQVNLTSRVRHAVGVGRHSSRPEDLVVDVGDDPLWVHAVLADLDRAVVHAVVAALHHAVGLEPAEVTLRRDANQAVLTVASPGYAIPVPEALRLIDHFGAAAGADHPVQVTARGGGTRVAAGAAELTTGRDGSVLTARFDLAPAGDLDCPERDGVGPRPGSVG